MIKNDPNQSRWRDFDKTPVSHSAAHYLMGIDSLRREMGYARLTDVANRLNVTKAATSVAIAQLKKKQLVTEDANRFLLLTPQGEQVVHEVQQNFLLLSRFFEEVLGVSKEAAEADACKMEHLLSLETGRRLLGLMRYVLSEPERAGMFREAVKNAPQECAGEASCAFLESALDTPEKVCGLCTNSACDGHAGCGTSAYVAVRAVDSADDVPAAAGMPLTQIEAGQPRRVVAIHGGEDIRTRLRMLGIRPGVKVTKVTGGLFRNGPIVIKHGQTQTALGHGICSRILVEEAKGW